MAGALSPGCAVSTHEFKGAASEVTAEATAFGLRRDHVLVEILALCADPADERRKSRSDAKCFISRPHPDACCTQLG
jgi:hypothetical protein